MIVYWHYNAVGLVSLEGTNAARGILSGKLLSSLRLGVSVEVHDAIVAAGAGMSITLATAAPAAG